jgi:hypothetical protein
MSKMNFVQAFLLVADEIRSANVDGLVAFDVDDRRVGTSMNIYFRRASSSAAVTLEIEASKRANAPMLMEFKVGWYSGGDSPSIAVDRAKLILAVSELAVALQTKWSGIALADVTWNATKKEYETATR